jgi:inhibitor of KinA sporulation pathway (predicted exonuclease)
MATIKHNRVLFLDTESTCWRGVPPDGFDNEIIQFGIVELDVASLQIIRSKSYYVKPKKYEISLYCQNLTGITDDVIRTRGRRYDHVLNTIINDFSPHNKITYAWGSDESIITKACNQFVMANPFTTMLDYGIQFKHLINQKENVSLSNALKMVGLQFSGNMHDAEIDAQNLANLYAQITKQFRKSLESANLSDSRQLASV